MKLATKPSTGSASRLQCCMNLLSQSAYNIWRGSNARPVCNRCKANGRSVEIKSCWESVAICRYPTLDTQGGNPALAHSFVSGNSMRMINSPIKIGEVELSTCHKGLRIKVSVNHHLEKKWCGREASLQNSSLILLSFPGHQTFVWSNMWRKRCVNCTIYLAICRNLD